MQSILIVDDIAENLYLLDVLLRGNGFAVQSATNGEEALLLARQHPPDLIVSDILMPVMDGYALCREWRADERLKAIPFIFYTATFTEKKDEELALSLGAERFVIKPQEPDVLMEIIRSVLADVASGVTEASRDESELLKEYNEALFRKLEKKMADLERTNLELHRTISEQRRLELQLRQAQKMEAVGRFSAGIAHDFNNILTVIIGFGEMMRHTIPDTDPQRNRIDQILAAAGRASNLTRSLLTFSRKQEMKLEPINLNQKIREIETFLRRVIGSDVRLMTSYCDKEIMVSADAGHIEQVLMNLATNARDAMPEGGILTIGTDIIEIDEEFVRLHGYGVPGRHALITVADTGSGMDADTRQQIFEPFFTTKAPGAGTGLGLSIIYGIIQQHHGQISVYSEPGSGTTFRVLLPLLAAERAVHEQPVPLGQVRGGDETILVVDRDESIRQYLEQLLTGMGYTVLLAPDATAALARLGEGGSVCALVLMDCMLGDAGCLQTIKALRSQNAGIGIICTSGYPVELLRERQMLDADTSVLMKPLLPVELLRAVRAVLDRSTL
jgi:signal transduction histidine kinase